MQGRVGGFNWHRMSMSVLGLHNKIISWLEQFPISNYSAPLGFCSLARRRMRRIRSIWVICEDSSIAATPLEDKRRGVLSSYPNHLLVFMLYVAFPAMEQTPDPLRREFFLR